MPQAIRVLLVDDDEDDYLIVRDSLRESGGDRYTMDWTSDYAQALEDMSFGRHQAYLVDYRLGARTGLDLVREALRLGSRSARILLTGQGGEKVDEEAMRAGFDDYLQKGQLTPLGLERAIRYAIERRRVIEALNESEARFSAFMQHSPAMAFLKDQEGRYVYVNAAAERLFQKPAAEVMGKTDFDMFPEATARELRENDAAVMAGEQPLEVNERVVLPEGSAREWVVFKFPIQDRNGRNYVAGTGVDVTEHRKDQAERERIERIAQARERLAFMGEIAAGVAHEFRNPLHGVLNCVKILRSNLENRAELTRWFDMAEEGLRRMDSISARLLRLGRDEMGPMVPADLQELSKGTVAFVQPRANKAQVELSCTVEPGLPKVPMDAERFSEALLNLLTNAVDACSPGGRVILTVGRSSQWPRMVEFQVSDTGPGIPAAIREKVFEPFFTTKPIGKGSGLGLALVKKILDSHGGIVALEARPGGGTLARVVLPEG